jgi:hypothetical protein
MGRKNGEKNVMMPNTDNMVDPREGGLDHALSNGMIDIRKANFIRIHVCGPEEAKKNLQKGRESCGDSSNFPCDA